MDFKTLAEKLKNMRKSKDFTQDKLASKSGVARSVIQDIEGAKGSPSLTTLAALETTLGDQLVYFEGLQDVDKIKRDAIIYASDFLARFAAAPPHIQKVLLMVAYKDASFLKDEPEPIVRDATKLLRALVSL